ncbi:MAG: flagellar motor switch protein FliG [Spirochaetaceae bacterium]|jgi:flagellar motor switch protein FliG|nr:flagellar motor switch protein FliG [Spirochaetaceae bacterium]
MQNEGFNKVSGNPAGAGALVKTAPDSSPKTSPESIYRRVAKFLLLIGVDEAAKVMSRLGEEQTEKIIPEIAGIKRVDPAEAAGILEEFQTLLERSREAGGVGAAREILEKAFGAERAQAVLEKAAPFHEGKPFEYLADFDGDRMDLLLREESPEVKTLVLSRIKPDLAAATISRLPSREKTLIVKRLAKMGPVLPEVLKQVDKRLQEKSLTLSADRSDKMDGENALAQILRRMDPEAGQVILESLERDSPQAAARLREQLFTLDDVARVDDQFIQEELAAMEDRDAVLLIAGKPEGFRTKILTNVSKGRGDRLLEDEQINRPFRREDCARVTSEFLGRLRNFHAGDGEWV